MYLRNVNETNKLSKELYLQKQQYSVEEYDVSDN